jgi:LysM repeat protein
MRYLRVILIAIIILGAGEVSAQFVSRAVKSESIVHIDGANYYIHNVGKGDTLYSLAKLYDVSEDAIRGNNPTAREGLKVGLVLKIPVQQPQQVSSKRQARLFEEHTVRAGETAYSIARSYGISVSTLIEDNPEVDPTRLPVGQQLDIRKKEIGGTAPWEVTRQWEEYRDAANRVSDRYVYHIVKPGETLYSLSRMFNTPRQTLIELNDLQDGLKANGIIRIPVVKSNTAGKQQNTAIEPYAQGQYPSFAERKTAQGRFNPSRTPGIALMLPLEGSTDANSGFVDFYRGVLVALDDLKEEGHSARVTLYNTARQAGKVQSIVSSLADADLIIGPVYEDAMAPAVQYADAYGIPVVSPLAAVRNLDSPMLYQMAPDSGAKYDKIRDEFSGGKNIILVSSGEGDDREFESEIVEQLGGNAYGRFVLGTEDADFGSLIDWERENVFVVLAGSEIGVDGALASISTAYNNASARTSRKADIRVIGSHRWAQYNSSSLDKTLFFKLNVCFVSSYYVDRSNDVVAGFESRFLENYGTFPSRSAYRGYDAVKLFVGALFRQGSSFTESLVSTDMTPLGMPYRFVQQSSLSENPTLRHTNCEWALVCFHSNYDIEVR